MPAERDQPGTCPQCDAKSYVREECAECDARKLDEAMANSVAGDLLQRAFRIEFELSKHITLGREDIGAAEFVALQILDHERNRYQAREQQKQAAARATTKVPNSY